MTDDRMSEAVHQADAWLDATTHLLEHLIESDAHPDAIDAQQEIVFDAQAALQDRARLIDEFGEDSQAVAEWRPNLPPHKPGRPR